MNQQFSHFISAGALTLALSGTAFAAGEYGSGQTGAMQQDPMQQQQAGAMDQQVDFSSLYKGSALTELEVQGADQQKLGSISEVLIDQNGQVSHVVVSEDGGIFDGGNNYLIPWDRLQIDAQQQTASLDVSGDQLSTEFSAFEEIPPTRLDQQQQQQDQDGMMDQPMQEQNGGMGGGMDAPPDSQIQ